MNQTHYYTEPYKAEYKWIVEKRTMEGKTLDTFEFSNKGLATEFLEAKTVTVLVEGKALID